MKEKEASASANAISPEMPAVLSPIAAAAPARPPKTTGEKYYDVLQFLTGKAFIVAITAVIAYMAHPKYGADSYFGVPNYLKQFQAKVEHFFMETLELGSHEGKHAERIFRVGMAATGTTLTMWGGNLFAPFLKALENRKDDISAYFNEKFGKPGEVEAGRERLKDSPKQNWGDIIKGRFVGWVAVFASFVAVDNLLGKSKTELTNAAGVPLLEKEKPVRLHRFDQYEEWFGRKMAGLTQAGKEIAHTPMSQALTDVQKENKHYRFGKIVALDFYATTAAILIWNAVSRISAKKREERHLQADASTPMAAQTEVAEPPKAGEVPAPATASPKPTIASHTARMQEKMAHAQPQQEVVLQ